MAPTRPSAPGSCLGTSSGPSDNPPHRGVRRRAPLPSHATQPRALTMPFASHHEIEWAEEAGDEAAFLRFNGGGLAEIRALLWKRWPADPDGADWGEFLDMARAAYDRTWH